MKRVGAFEVFALFCSLELIIFITWIRFSKQFLSMGMQASHYSVGSNREFKKQLDFSISEAMYLYTI